MKLFDVGMWRAARRALERAIRLHIADPNVSHIDLGFRTLSSDRHRVIPELAVRVHVRRKLHGEAFDRFAEEHPQWVVDAQRIGFAIDVPEVEYVKATIGTHERTAEIHHGTLGRKVGDCQTGERLVLTTLSVLTDTLNGVRPGKHLPAAGGSDDCPHNAVELIRDATGADLDAAVARIHGRNSRETDDASATPIIGPGLPQLGMVVRLLAPDGNSGECVVSGIMGCGLYSCQGRLRLIRHLVHVTLTDCSHVFGCVGAWWCEPGASGLRAIGIHFAESTPPGFALAVAMPEVLHALDVEIVTDPVGKRGPSCHALNVSPCETHELTHAPARIATPAGLVTRLEKAAQTLINTLPLLMLTTCAHWHVPQTMDQETRAAAMHLEVAALETAVRIDSLRQAALRKIVTIIHRFNPEMASPSTFLIANEIFEMSLKYPNLDADLICATITHESGRSWNPRSLSPVGAMGLMQVMPSTGVALAREEGIAWNSAEAVLYDPVLNIRLGCRYLSGLVKVYSVEGGLAAYNGGEKRAQRWVSSGRADGILHEETAFYVPSIMKIYEQYRLNKI